MTPPLRRPIALIVTQRHAGHAVRRPVPARPRHPVVRAAEAQIRDAGVPRHARGFLQTRGQIVGHLAEDGDLALEGFLVATVGHVAGDVRDEAVLGGAVEDLFPEGAGRPEVFGADLGEEGHGGAGEVAVDFVRGDGALAEVDGFDGGDVVGAGSLVVEGHAAVALEVAHAVAGAGRVDGELLVVDPDAVAVGVGVGEEAGLEDGVGGRFEARDQVRGVEGNLFDFGEVVGGVFVERELADLAEGELLVRPDVGEVEDVDLFVFPELFGFLGRHGLDFETPFREFASLNRLVEILLCVVG